MIKLSEKPLWTDSMSYYPFNSGIVSAMTFVSRFGDNVVMAKVEGNHVLVPRQLAPLGDDKRSTRFLGAINCKEPALFDEQQEVIDKSFGLISQGIDHVIEAPTGFGKTYVGGAIAARLGQATLIVVQKQDLMDQWKDTLVNLIGVPLHEIGIAQGKQCVYEGKRFVIGMVQSLMIDGKFDSYFWGYFGLGLFDEVDTLAAECFSKVCQQLKAKYRIGLSATPKRSDGKTPVIDAHIGPIMVKGIDIPMSPKILVKHTGWSMPAWMSNNLDAGKMMHVYKAMASDLNRNNLIVQFIKSCYKQGRRVLVLSDIVDHLKLLQSMSIQAGISALDCGLYIGELAKQKSLLKQNANKKVILATYGMCGRGTNYPQWDAEVAATPRSNCQQPLGRILRRKKDKKTPVALDLVDNHKVFKGFYYSRLKIYNSLKAEVIKLV